MDSKKTINSFEMKKGTKGKMSPEYLSDNFFFF